MVGVQYIVADEENIVYILEATLYVGADTWANTKTTTKVLK